MALSWTDHEALARALHARFPTRDPLTVRLPDLARWVSELPDFAAGDPRPGWRQIEALQAAWYAAYRAPLAPSRDQI